MSETMRIVRFMQRNYCTIAVIVVTAGVLSTCHVVPATRTPTVLAAAALLFVVFGIVDTLCLLVARERPKGQRSRKNLLSRTGSTVRSVAGKGTTMILTVFIAVVIYNQDKTVADATKTIALVEACFCLLALIALTAGSGVLTLGLLRMPDRQRSKAFAHVLTNRFRATGTPGLSRGRDDIPSDPAVKPGCFVGHPAVIVFSNVYVVVVLWAVVGSWLTSS